MKTCVSCGNMLSEDAPFCYVCSTPQAAGFSGSEAKPKYDTTFLKILCGFTIAGTVLHFIFLPFSWKSMAVMPYAQPDLILGLTTLFVLGKLAGAILMLRRKLPGLHVYTGSSLMGIVTTLVLAMKLTQYMTGIISAFVCFAFILFPVTFLVLYWLPQNRRVLS